MFQSSIRPALLVLVALGLTACGKAEKKSENEKEIDQPVTPATVIGSLAVNVIMPKKQGLTLILNSCPPGATVDTPDHAEGSDCDNDGGIVAKQTPKTFTVAFKRIYLKDKAGVEHNLFNFDRLADIDASGTFDFSDEAQLHSLPLPSAAVVGGMSGVGYEIYYYDMTLKMYGQDRKIRIYMSDDDFANEGSKGHHQGDVTWTDVEGVERWVRGGSEWFESSDATKARGDFANGIGGIDPESGHQRGMFGGEDFWNASTFMQGTAQDIYRDYKILSLDETKISLKFDISNTWFFEDFDNNGSFDPCSGGSLEGCGGEWAPIAPAISAISEAPAPPSDGVTLEVPDEIKVRANEQISVTIMTGKMDDGVSPTTMIDLDQIEGATVSATAEGEVFTWTPTPSMIRSEPYLVPIRVYDESGRGFFKIVKVYVTE